MTDSNAPAHELASHSFAWHRHWQRRTLFVCFATGMVFGTIGYTQYLPGTSFTNALYGAVQLFSFHSPHFETDVPWTLEIGRWLAGVTTAFAGFQLLRRMWQEERDAQRIRRMKQHVIVCGLGRRGLAAVQNLTLQQRKRVVVIDKAPAPDMAEACRKLGVHLLTGDATNPDVLQAARIGCASALVTLCPEDSTNYEIAAHACNLRAAAGECPEPLQCQIQVGDAEARKALQELLARRHEKSNAVIRFFDTFDPQVRQLLVHQLPLDHAGIKPDDVRPVHLVILGFGRMGRTLAVRAAQLGVFAQPGRLKISVIDRRANTHRAELLFRHPQIGAVCDIEFHELESISPETRDKLKEWCSRPDTITSVAICFDEEQRALEIALMLKTVAPNHARVAVRMSANLGLASLMSATKKTEPGGWEFIPFGMTGTHGLGEDAVEQFARKIHAAYVKMRQAEAGEDAARQEKLKRDPAMRDWDDLPEDFRESNRQQADHIHIKLRALGLEAVEATDARPAVTEFTPAKIEVLAEMEHRRYLAERRMANWTFGPKKDEARRENPSMIDWDKLTEEVKEYDRVAVRAIPKLLAGAGPRSKIVRL